MEIMYSIRVYVDVASGFRVRKIMVCFVFRGVSDDCNMVSRKQMDALILQHKQLFNKNEAWRKRLFPRTTGLFSQPAACVHFPLACKEFCLSCSP